MGSNPSCRVPIVTVAFFTFLDTQFYGTESTVDRTVITRPMVLFLLHVVNLIVNGYVPMKYKSTPAAASAASVARTLMYILVVI